MFEEQKEEHIREQVIDKGQSRKLRRKLLEKGQELTLNQALSITRSSEAADVQAQKIESGNESKVEPSGGINIVSGGKHGRCHRCGKDGHFARDKICPALEASCRKCHFKGHYADRCKTKPSRYRFPEAESARKKSKGSGPEASKSANRGKGRGRQQRGNKQRVDCVEDDDEYAFHVFGECVLVLMVELFNSRLVVQLLKEC